MSWEHKGYRIEINSHGRFSAEVNELEIVGDSLKEIQAAIEKECSKPKRLLSLPVVGIMQKSSYYRTEKDGMKVAGAILTGINRTTSEMMVSGLPAKMNLTEIMPDTDYHRTLLEKYITARKELERINKEMAVATLKIGRSHGRIEAADYDELLDNLKLDYKKSKRGISTGNLSSAISKITLD